MTDQEDQADELLALCHIFDESVFTSVPGGEGEEAGGQFLWCPELPDGATVLLQTPAGAAVEQLDVKYLPPVALNFQLPADYPSRDPPQFTLSSKWLTMQQLSSLCERLDALWKENQGMVVLFLWMNFLQDEAFSFLELNFPLDLSEVLVRRGSGSEPHPVAIGLKVTPTTTPCDPRAIQDIASQGLLRLALLDFDKQERQRQFERSCFSCEVCFQEKLGVHCINFPGCEHVYCKDCMRDFFTIQIRDGNVNGLTCPALKCESQAHPSQVQNLVSPELFTRYDELLLQTGLQTMLDIVHCPRPQCQCPVIIDRERSLGSCPSCYYVFCTLCKFTYHSMAPCKIRSDELKKLREEYLAASEEEKLELERRYGKRTLRNAVEEAYSNEWLDQFSKQCPSCSAHIQKIDGCNKMTCMKCRAYFCWMCSQVLSRNNPYSHFNSPGSPCFNRLFEGTIIDDDEFDDW